MGTDTVDTSKSAILRWARKLQDGPQHEAATFLLDVAIAKEDAERQRDELREACEQVLAMTRREMGWADDERREGEVDGYNDCLDDVGEYLRDVVARARSHTDRERDE